MTERAPDEPDDAFSEAKARVLAELLATRKSREGLTVASLTSSPTMCRLLGNGDPLLAYNRFKQRALKHLRSTESLAVEAALASLGLTALGSTHLARLDEFGSDRGYEQRQVRRHSDQGVRVLAHLIATNWVGASSPVLSLMLWPSADRDRSATARIEAHWPVDLSMRAVEVQLASGAVPTLHQLSGAAESDGWLIEALAPLSLGVHDLESGVKVSWPGEIWPRFAVRLVGAWDHVLAIDALGNSLVIAYRGLE